MLVCLCVLCWESSSSVSRCQAEMLLGSSVCGDSSVCGASSGGGGSSVCVDSACPMECSLNGAMNQGLAFPWRLFKHAYLQILLFIQLIQMFHSEKHLLILHQVGDMSKPGYQHPATSVQSPLTSGILLAMRASWNGDGALCKDFSTHLVSSSS